MEQWLVDMLNQIGQGVAFKQVTDLLTMPAEYNSRLYQLALNVAQTAVKPIASIVLAVIFTLELARISSKVDGDRELGTKMIATLMIKCALILTAAQHTPLLLQCIEQLGGRVLNGVLVSHSVQSVVGTTGIGDQLRQQIHDSGIPGQAACCLLVILPFLLSHVVSIMVIVVMMLRFVQVYLLAAFNPLPIAFLAHEETKSWGVNYFKQYAIYIFQGVSILIALLMYRSLAQDTLKPPGEGVQLTDWVFGNFGSLFMNSVLLGMLVIVANGVAKRLFGGE